MLQIKSKKSVLECSCTLNVTDDTGEKVLDTDTGFTKKGEPLADNTDFHFEDGVLLNMAYTFRDKIYKTSNDDVVKPNGLYQSVDSLNSFSTCLPIDGMHHSLTVFVMTKKFLESQPDDWFDSNKGIIFYDPDNTRLVYRANGEDLYIETLNGIVIFLQTMADDVELQGISIEIDNCYTICNLLACKNSLIQEYLDKSLGYDKKGDRYRCPSGNCKEDDNLKADMEFLRSAVATLQYLIACKNFDDSDRILALLAKCGNICSRYPKRSLNGTNNGCGCN